MPTPDPAVGGIAFLFKGGFMMYPLLLSGLIALTVSIERFFIMRFRMANEPGLVGRVLDLLKTSGDLQAPLKLVTPASRPVASVLEVGLRDPSAPIEEIELSMQTQAEMWVPLLEKRLDILDTVITAAPLMGLLGTITGMMSSFQVLSEKGVNEPHAITGGVAEALIATATGLVIALLCLCVYNYFNHRVKMIIFEMESAGAQLLEARKILMRKSK